MTNQSSSPDSFHGFDLDHSLSRILVDEKFSIPTPVQAEAIPLALSGRDILASAQTGSGKTAAFALPILQLLSSETRRPDSGKPRALILAPTRELAGQIAEVFTTFSRHLKVAVAVIYGGVGKGSQINAMRRGVDVVVATPGRLLDLMQEGVISLDHVKTIVLDEADRMLDMGFIPDVRRIIAKLPRQRQSLFFSATLPPPVVSLAEDFLTNPARITIETNEQTTPKIDQHIMFVTRDNKRDALRMLLTERGSYRALVFTRTKHRAKDIAKYLTKHGITSDDLQGNKSQNARIRALNGFHSGDLQVLVATDIASRGIDVDDIDHVINFELPHEPESYVHRIGRTARAGKVGTAVSLCDESEVDDLMLIQRAIGSVIPVMTDHPFHEASVAEAALNGAARRSSGGSGGRSGGAGSSRGGDSSGGRSRSGGSSAPRGNRAPGGRSGGNGTGRSGGAGSTGGRSGGTGSSGRSGSSAGRAAHSSYGSLSGGESAQSGSRGPNRSRRRSSARGVTNS